ncbi:phospho-sugar mutase [Ornithinimicrobium sufpigmenti]|uniref:phospho-sugar mutase n=1 Tax=Ornithinimicrobium sufpigmenti TaxID=2508882 RepID=UPI001036E687|nr:MULTISPECIES: phospho-sugar mutase [unclassified Ornithinimicrobium]
MTDQSSREQLLHQARTWVGDDPDPHTRDELTAFVDRAVQGDEAAWPELADRFAGFLEFGTAGLRGALGSGPNRMNRAVVIRTAAGLTAYLRQQLGLAGEERGPVVVIGFDARHNSDVFARDTAAVVTAAGGRAMMLPRPLPTPVLAFAIQHLGADAGVMVTASHNPPQDNGYKVYLGDGSQIVPPADLDIAAQIARIRTVSQVAMTGDGWETLGEEILDAYLDAAVAVLDPSSPRELKVVHTALHGVGSDVVRKAFERAGFTAPEQVAEQAEPDPEFPTVAFPNPEEPGAIDAALALAERVQPDLVIANDPDADRCALAVRDGGGDGGDGDGVGWRMLRGDEVGALLGQHVIDRGLPTSERPVLARSIVSSRLLGALADAAGLRGEETLTGFKWIGRVPGLAYGYEEALGYCVDPATVPDKDGVTAALLAAELAATLKAQGRTLTDVLDDLALTHGVHQTDAFSVRVSDLGLIAPVMTRLREDTPEELGGTPVSRMDDLALGEGGLPPTEGVRFYLADDTRVIVRPSGTEPKLKVYLEAIVPVTGPDGLTAARAEATRRLAAVRASMEGLTAV